MSTLNRFLVVMCLFLFGMHASYCQQSKFHAVFLSKFSENVSWPTPVYQNVIGVIGKTDVLKHLTDFSKLRSNMRVMAVSTPREASECNILYVTSSEIKSIDEYNEVIKSNSILVVSETERSVGDKSDIGFFLEQGKLRFLVSKSALESKGLVMGSNLLGRGKIQ